MATYLVEAYEPKLSGDGLAQAARRAQEAAEALACEGTAVRFLGAIVIPGDETCFFLYKGPTAIDVGEAIRRAAIAFDRVVEAEHVGPEGVRQ